MSVEYDYMLVVQQSDGFETRTFPPSRDAADAAVERFRKHSTVVRAFIERREVGPWVVVETVEFQQRAKVDAPLSGALPRSTASAPERTDGAER